MNCKYCKDLGSVDVVYSKGVVKEAPCPRCNPEAALVNAVTLPSNLLRIMNIGSITFTVGDSSKTITSTDKD